MRALSWIRYADNEAERRHRREVEQAREEGWPSTFHYLKRLFTDREEAEQFAREHTSKFAMIEERLHGPSGKTVLVYHSVDYK